MSIKLLVADDSITIQKVIGIIFGGEGYSLTVVDNGLAAVEKARELSPDVLLIDALMPGMTGYEVCEAVRAIPALAAKPILILTGSFEPFDEDKAKKCGADDFLAKPFESQQIVSKVKELAELGASRAARSVPAPEPLAPEPFAAPEPAAAFVFEEADPFGAFEFPEPEPASVFASPPIEAVAPFKFSAPEAATAFAVAAAAFVAPEAAQTTTPSDIWGAFTPDVEPPSPPVLSPQLMVSGFSDTFEPDVFAIVNEESESQLVQSAAITPPLPQITGIQWIPVEEQTFEFIEENVAEIPLAALAGLAAPYQDSGFGDIVFEDGDPVQKTPVSTAVVVEPAASAFMTPEPEFTPPAFAVHSINTENIPLESVAASFIAITADFHKPLADVEDVDYVPDVTPSVVAAPTVKLEIDPLESVATSFIALTADVHKPLAVVEVDDYVPAVCAPAVCAQPVAIPAVSAPAVEAPTVSIPAVASPAELSEEHLRAAISAVSREVIERIVWEVVPDLAEAMIREAIRKIKEGV